VAFHHSAKTLVTSGFGVIQPFLIILSKMAVLV